MQDRRKSARQCNDDIAKWFKYFLIDQQIENWKGKVNGLLGNHLKIEVAKEFMYLKSDSSNFL